VHHEDVDAPGFIVLAEPFDLGCIGIGNGTIGEQEQQEIGLLLIGGQRGMDVATDVLELDGSFVNARRGSPPF